MPVQKIEEGNLEYSPFINVKENNRKSFTLKKKELTGSVPLEGTVPF